MSHLTSDADAGDISSADWIAYTKLTDGAVTGGNWNIYLTGLDGTPERQITHHPVAYELAWSPDGRYLAYPCSRYAGSEYVAALRILDMQTGTDLQVIANDIVPAPLTWTPDSHFIACLLPHGRRSDIALMSLDGTEVRLLMQGADSPSWSPDGSRLTYLKREAANRGIALFVASADGSGEIPLATDGLFPDAPCWSPDGQYIGFLGEPDDQERGLYIMAPDGSGPRRLADVDIDSGLAWSPDGCWLAFVGDDEEESGGYAMCVVSVESGSVRTVVAGMNGGDGGEMLHPTNPAWSPDGRWIAFASYEADGGHNLYVVAPDGTNRRQLTHDTEADYRGATWGMPIRYNLAWRPRR